MRTWCPLSTVRRDAGWREGALSLAQARRYSDDHLRKDYAFLFERFFKFLDLQASGQRGLVVFDELERSQSHLLIDQRAWRRDRGARGHSATGL